MSKSHNAAPAPGAPPARQTRGRPEPLRSELRPRWVRDDPDSPKPCAGCTTWDDPSTRHTLVVSDHIHEPWIERVIREATERGEFDDLPGSGKPIPDLDRPYDPAWWARKWTTREQLIERAADLDTQVRRELPSLIADRDRRRSRDRVAEINAAITALNEHLPEADRLREVRLPDDPRQTSG